MSRLRMVRAIALSGILMSSAVFLPAQQQLSSGASGRGFRAPIPPIDTAIADRGQLVYAANCASCHGPDARGTSRGVDLVRAFSVRLDPTGAQLGQFLAAGHPRDSASPVSFSGGQVTDLAMYQQTPTYNQATGTYC